MIKILISLHTMPTVRSYKQIIVNQIIPTLKNYEKVKIFWFVYMPEKIIQNKQHEYDEEVLDIHDFNDAFELIQKIKPDIIYSSPTNNLPDYALNLAAKYSDIPTIGEIMNDSITDINSKEVMKFFVKGFFDDSVPTDTSEKKQFMRRGRFFIFKYKFLMKTQKSIRYGVIRRIIESLTIIRDSFFEPIKGYNPRFSCTKQFVESNLIMKQLIQNKFNESALEITGIPIHDPLFNRINERKDGVKRKNTERKIILFLTHSLVEHGFQTREQREFIIKSIVKEHTKISKEYRLIVKIHPSSEKISDYKEIISNLSQGIEIVQKGDILEFIEDADIVITYSTSTAPKQAILYKKPVIICNFFDIKNDPLLERELAYNCKKVEELVPAIQKLQKQNIVTDEKLKEFVNEFFYKSDGKSTERVCKMILELVKQFKEKKQH